MSTSFARRVATSALVLILIGCSEADPLSSTPDANAVVDGNQVTSTSGSLVAGQDGSAGSGAEALSDPVGNDFPNPATGEVGPPTTNAVIGPPGESKTDPDASPWVQESSDEAVSTANSLGATTTVVSTPSTDVVIDTAGDVQPSTTVPVTTTSLATVADPVPSTGPREWRFVIPRGTNERIQAGEAVDDVLPTTLTAQLGDTIVLVNNDDVFHIYGPVSARSGETVSWLLGQPGTFSGLCTVSSERQVTLTVLDT